MLILGFIGIVVGSLVYEVVGRVMIKKDLTDGD